MEEAEKRVAAVLRADVSCQEPPVSHSEQATILRRRYYTAESCAAHLFPETARVRVMEFLDSLCFGDQAGRICIVR